MLRSLGFWVLFLLSVWFSSLLVSFLLGLLRLLGIYDTVNEREAKVYVLFGKVVAVIAEPGLHILPLEIGPKAFLVRILGQRYQVDIRLDQQYLRSQPVNSEEGAPMGVGVWYEMYVTDPVKYIFENVNPKGSLAANVGNASVQRLSNLKLATLLEDRHAMSREVRDAVSPVSAKWGYRIGSVYIRKVHFRDPEMMRQIMGKVVNRLTQVTAAIKQDGENQVGIIRSSADRDSAVEFAKAIAMRPEIVGKALQEVSKDPEVLGAVLEALRIQALTAEKGPKLTIVPKGVPLLLGMTSVKS